MKRTLWSFLAVLLLGTLLLGTAYGVCLCDEGEHDWKPWTYYEGIYNQSSGEYFEGKTGVRSCRICGLIEYSYHYADGRVYYGDYLFNGDTHEWSDWKVTKEATCTEDGIKSCTCSNCGKTKTVSIPKTGHNWVTMFELNGTLPECSVENVRNGMDIVYHCRNCGAREEGDYYGPWKHTWGEWTVTKKATCTKNGSRTRTCTVCGEKETETVSKSTAHQFGNWVVTKEATCTKGGKEKSVCKLCGASKTRDIEKLGHNFSEYRIIVEATDCSKGKRSAACERCGKTIEEEFYPEGTLYKGGDNPPDRVIALHQALANLGLYKGKIVGEYGNATAAAVSKFEKNYLGMKQDGIAWPKVLRALGVAGKQNPDGGDDHEAVSTDTSNVKLLLEAKRVSPLTGSFAAGDTITIQWTLTNRTAKDKASSIHVYRFAGMKADKKKDAAIAEHDALEPGESLSGTYEYTVTAADAEAGRFTVGFIARGRIRKKGTESNRVWFNFLDGVADPDESTSEQPGSGDDPDAGAENTTAGSDETDNVEITTLEWIAPDEPVVPQLLDSDNAGRAVEADNPAAGACEKRLIASVGGTSEYALAVCARHAGTAAEAVKRMDAGEYTRACALWDAEIDALFAEWIGKADADGAVNAVEEQAAFNLQLKSLEAALALVCKEDEAAAVAAEERMNECVRLCGVLHADGSPFSADTAPLPDSEAGKSCTHRITWQEGGSASIADSLCETHRNIARLAGRLLENITCEEDLVYAWQRAQEYWLLELNAMYDIWYLSADESRRGAIVTARISFEQLLEARKKTLASLYPDNSAAAAEILANMIMDRTELLCRVLHQAGILTY